MQFKTIVKNPKVLEKFFSPLFLNLKEGECLEDYRQNPVVDDFLNSIPKTYNIGDLEAFYAKTGIKVEHQRFSDYWSFWPCSMAGEMPEISLDDLCEMSEDEITEKFGSLEFDRDDMAIELREGDWEKWRRYEELGEKADALEQEHVMRAYRQRATDVIESVKFYEVGQFDNNAYYAILITEDDQMGVTLGIPSEGLKNSGIFTVVLKNYETPDLDEGIEEIKEVLTEELEDWEEHWMKAVLKNLEECKEYFEERTKILVKEYLQGIYEKYC